MVLPLVEKTEKKTKSEKYLKLTQVCNLLKSSERNQRF